LERQAYWLAPLIAFLALRLFSGDSYFLLGGDQCTFLELGRTFPKHQLWDHELYLIHPPPFGWTIGLLHLVLPLVAAGLAASLIFAVVNFFAVRSLGENEALPRGAICTGLVYLTLSRGGVAYDYHVARVSILVAATSVALLAFLKLMRTGTRRALWCAIAANIVCLLVSDQSVVLLPCEARLLWARGSFRQWHWAWLCVASLAAAAVWPAVRLLEYGRHTNLPAGIDGTIEFTSRLPWMAAIQPNYLPFTNVHRSLFTQTSLSLANLKPALLADLPTDLLGMPRTLSALLVLALIVAALSRAQRRRNGIAWLGLSLLFLLPVGVGMNEWYSMGFIAPFSLLMMEGAASILDWTARLKQADAALTAGLSSACALVAVLWLAAPAPESHGLLEPRGGIQFLFARPPLTRGAAIAHFFDSMPRDTGIMASPGLSPELVYLTDRRVVAVPFNPQLLDQFVREYRITYVVTSTEYLPRYVSPVANQWTGHLAIQYISQHPERYKLVQKLSESYPAFYPAAEYLVFHVIAE